MSIKRTEKIVSSDLNSRYLSIIEEKNDATYFLKIAEYGNYLLSNNKIDYVYEDIKKEHKNQLKAYEKELRKFVKSFKKEGSVVVKSFEEAKNKGIIETPPEELSALKEKVGVTDLNHYWNDVAFLWNDYVWVMRYLEDRKDSNKEIQKLYKKLTSKVGGSRQWKLWAEHTKAEEAWQDFKNKREISTWWAHFKVLMIAAGVYDPKTRQKYLTIGEELDSLYTWEFKQIQQGQTSNLILVNKNKYEKYIRKLHYYLIGRVGNEVPIIYLYNEKEVIPQLALQQQLSTEEKLNSKSDDGIIYKSGLFYDTNNEWVFRKSKDLKIPITVQSEIGLFLIELIKNESVSKNHMLEKYPKRYDGGKYNFRKNLRLRLLKDGFMTDSEVKELIPPTKKGLPYSISPSYSLS